MVLSVSHFDIDILGNGPFCFLGFAKRGMRMGYMGVGFIAWQLRYGGREVGARARRERVCARVAYAIGAPKESINRGGRKRTQCRGIMSCIAIGR